MKKLLLAVALSFVTACTSTHGDAWCLTNEALRPNKAAVQAADDAFLRQIDSHNTYGQKVCGWKFK